MPQARDQRRSREVNFSRGSSRGRSKLRHEREAATPLSCLCVSCCWLCSHAVGISRSLSPAGLALIGWTSLAPVRIPFFPCDTNNNAGDVDIAILFNLFRLADRREEKNFASMSLVDYTNCPARCTAKGNFVLSIKHS